MNGFFRKIVRSVLLTALVITHTGCREKSYEPVSVSFSVSPGTCAEGTVLQLSAPKNYTIRYTTDGTLPDEKSSEYREGIVLSGSGNSWLDEETIALMKIDVVHELNEAADLPDAWIIRAVAYAPDGTAGPVSTGTYFPGRSLVSDYGRIMVVSLVCEPDALLDYETGIMVKGRVFDEWITEDDHKNILIDHDFWYLIQANYTQKGKDWERPLSVELFDGSDELSFQQDAAFRLQGSASRMFSHKSFRLYARSQYGASQFSYPLFAGDAESYKYITLRNGGNAANDLIFKDGWQQSLLADRHFATQKTRPAVVFLNGEYWGVYCLNDRYCAQYVQDHYGIENAVIVKEGEFEDGNEEASGLYDELLAYAERDFRDEEVWKEFCSVMDVQSMADYFAADIYMANYDFKPDKNCELWRSVEAEPQYEYGDGRWRFMMYDTEFSSGMYNGGMAAFDRDSLQDVIDNFPLFASVLQAPAFRVMLMDSLKQIGSSDLSSERVNETVDRWDAEWSGLMGEQYQRFGDYAGAWQNQIGRIKDFYAKRYDFIVPLAETKLSELE